MYKTTLLLIEEGIFDRSSFNQAVFSPFLFCFVHLRALPSRQSSGGTAIRTISADLPILVLSLSFVLNLSFLEDTSTLAAPILDTPECRHQSPNHISRPCATGDVNTTAFIITLQRRRLMQRLTEITVVRDPVNHVPYD